MSESPKSGGELFIVDNSDEAWKGLKYLQDWTEIASAFDIASGYFEIGARIALDGRGQKLEKFASSWAMRCRRATVGIKPTLKCWMELN